MAHDFTPVNLPSAVRALGAGLILGLSSSGMSAVAGELVSLNEDALHPHIEFLDATIVTNVGNTIEVQTGGLEDWPNISFRSGPTPWNLAAYQTLKVDLTNAGSSPANIGLRVDNPYEDKDSAPHAQGYERFEPAETRTLSVRLTAGAEVLSPSLDLVGMRRNPGTQWIDPTNIDRIQIFVGHADGPRTFRVSNLRAEGEVTRVDSSGFLPFVDRYGQNRHRDWPGKIRADEDLVRARDAEAATWENRGPNPGRSGFGGWTEGPRLDATGFFRVEKLDGQWWLVDPEGYLFWSTGPTCISPDFGYTGVEGRESYFDRLPEPDHPLAQFYSRSSWAPHGFYKDKIPFTIFQFYKANLYRKYGEAWEEHFYETVHHRLRSWGMNTIANWAARDLYLQQRTPYVANFFISGNRTLEASRGYWAKFHDVFDPSFRRAIRKRLDGQAAEARDPWCIGFYVDNELSWGLDGISLAMETLACGPAQPAKLAFLDDLKARYETIERLNLAWGTRHLSWGDLLDCREPPDPIRAAADLEQFYIRTADTYFRTVKQELARAAPNHLYLGCRFAWVNDAVALSAARHCDVVSYNKYTHGIRGIHLPGYIDRPMIIGEFHFGATDQGHFHPGMVGAETQVDRGRMYEAYIRSGLENPQVVGAHWFQFVDESIAGRADEENYNVGLVDICDSPYPELVEAIRRSGDAMYPYRRERARTESP